MWLLVLGELVAFGLFFGAFIVAHEGLDRERHQQTFVRASELGGDS